MVVFYKIYKQYSEIQLTKKQNGHEQWKIAILEIKNVPLLKKKIKLLYRGFIFIHHKSQKTVPIT